MQTSAYAMMGGMKPPLFIRSLTAEECTRLKAALHNRNAFIARRAQIVLASARGERPRQIATNLSCATQTVRTAIRDFTARRAECLVPRSSRPKSARRILDEKRCEQLRAILHESPRSFGKEQSLWTLAAVAEVACSKGLTPAQLSLEAIRQALSRMNVSWRRAKNWITSPDPQYARKKSSASG